MTDTEMTILRAGSRARRSRQTWIVLAFYTSVIADWVTGVAARQGRFHGERADVRDGHDASDSGGGLRRLFLQTGVAAMEEMEMIYQRKLSRM